MAGEEGAHTKREGAVVSELFNLYWRGMLGLLMICVGAPLHLLLWALCKFHPDHPDLEQRYTFVARQWKSILTFPRREVMWWEEDWLMFWNGPSEGLWEQIENDAFGSISSLGEHYTRRQEFSEEI
jgi:hypothetical protein